MTTFRQMVFSILVALLLVAAVVLVFTGIQAVSAATFGVWQIGLAVLCAVLARIAQAALHHSEDRQRGKE